MWNIFKRKKKILKSRTVTKARFLYLYMICGAVSGLIYLGVAIYLGLPKHYSFTPLYALVLFVIGNFIYKNWKMFWLFVTDVQRGRLLMYLNDNTHFEPAHKLKLIEYVYPKPKEIRHEEQERIMLKLYEGKKDLSEIERAIIRNNPVYCPQQLRDGINEAILVEALIYAHQNIQVLGDDLRRVMNLTDENMLAFSLEKEVDKCKKDKFKKYVEIGEKAAKRLKEDRNDS